MFDWFAHITFCEPCPSKIHTQTDTGTHKQTTNQPTFRFNCCQPKSKMMEKESEDRKE